MSLAFLSLKIGVYGVSIPLSLPTVSPLSGITNWTGVKHADIQHSQSRHSPFFFGTGRAT